MTTNNQPRGLARLDSTGLAQLREILLRVIDDGDPILRHPWRFYKESFEPDDSFADAQRLDYCDAVCAAIVAKTTPAVEKDAGCVFLSKGE